MPENKTKPTGASVDDYLASKASEQQHVDCRRLMTLLKRVTRQPAKMWGPSIVGFGSYHYTYESGRTGDAPLAGFSVRGREIVIYIAADDKTQRLLLSKLGEHRMGKYCLYIKRLSDVDASVLEKLVTNSVADMKRRYA